jgi:hypothetical protein
VGAFGELLSSDAKEERSGRAGGGDKPEAVLNRVDLQLRPVGAVKPVGDQPHHHQSCHTEAYD